MALGIKKTKPEAPRQESERLYHDRWSSFGSNTGIVQLSEALSPADMKQYSLFQGYDDAFLNRLSPDISVATWKEGTVLFEEGGYLDLAFYIVEGSVDVYLAKHQEDVHRPIFNATRVLSRAEVEKGLAAQAPPERPGPGRPAPAEGITFLATMDFDLPRGEVMRLQRGDIFGEIGALNGWPLSVTARTNSRCTLVQIRVPALRQMKRHSSDFSDYLDKIYRERTLFVQLKSNPLFSVAGDQLIEALSQNVELVSHEPGDVITREGEAADALYIIRSGFVQLAQRVGEGDMVVSYLSKGMTLGEVELLVDPAGGWQYTSSSVGYTELLKIGERDFAAIAQHYPSIEHSLWESAVDKIKETGYTRKNLDKSELIEFSLGQGLVQGNSMLVIDLDVCTRCDDCVRGCASAHGGRPRFVREGEKYGDFLIARSCYHCEDPVCLIGCPTGAIRRANVGEVVEIEDSLCIGCGNCANKCPYDAIVMHDTGETWPDTALPEWLRGRERRVASKCDLCYTSDAGPACVNNCPHACAFRITSLDDFQHLLSVNRES